MVLRFKDFDLKILRNEMLKAVIIILRIKITAFFVFLYFDC